MAIVAVNEIWDGRSGEVDEKGIRKYVRTFRVQSDSLTELPNTVTAACNIPLYAPYPTDAGAINKRQSARQDTEEPFLWIVTFTYDSAPFEASDTSGGPSNSNNNQQQPDLRPWTFKFGSRKSTRPLTRDIEGPFGGPVVNSAGQPFDPTIEVPCSWPTIQITAYKSVFNFNTIDQFQDAINDAAWMGFAEKTVRCVEYGVTSQYDNGRFFWQLDVQLEYNRDGWNPVKVLDAGTVEKYTVGAEVRYRQITDAYGQPVNAPVPLDGTGQKLEPDGTLHYLEFNPYREVNFNNLI